MAYVPNSGSVVAFQSDPSVLQTLTGLMSTNASVITVGGAGVANQSVSGTVGASVIGHAPVFIVGGSVLTTTGNSSVQVLNFPTNQSVSGAVSVSNFPTTQNVSGSVAAWLQSTNASVITVGSPVANQSVSGTIGASIIGTVPVTQVTTPWTVVSSLAGGLFPISGSVAAFITNTNINVSGSVVAFPTGTQAVSGSVATLQGTNPWIVNTSNSSVLVRWQAPSIVGTYAEDSAHATAHNGLFTLAVRNDTVASFAGANSDYSAFATDSAGRTIIKPFAAGEASFIGINSIVSAGTAASVLLTPAPGAGLKTYVTDWALGNTGATTVVALITDSDSSIMGRAVLPAGGGNNKEWTTPLVSTRANTSLHLQLVGSSSVIYATVTGFRAP